MKPKKLNLLTIFLLLLPFYVVLLWAGCEKQEWQELQLTDTSCSQAGESMGGISDVMGEIERFNENEYIIIVKDVLNFSELPLYPCNIHFSDLMKKSKIIISGEVFLYEGQDNDSIAISLGAQPILISNAKIYK